MPTHTAAIVIPGDGFDSENRIFRERTSGSTRTRWVSEYSEHRRPATCQRGIRGSSLEQFGPDFSKARVSAENRALEVVQERLFLPAPAQSAELNDIRGFSPFCQLFGDPLVGVFGADADLSRRDDDDVAVGKIRERIDFVAAIYGEGAAAEKEKGNVGAEAGGDGDQARERNFAFGETHHADQRSGCVAGAAAEAARDGDYFVKVRIDAIGEAEFGAHFVDGAINEIFRASGQIGIFDRERDAWFAPERKLERIVQRNGLKNCAQLVVAVWALANHAQVEIHFRVRVQPHKSLGVFLAGWHARELTAVSARRARFSARCGASGLSPARLSR